MKNILLIGVGGTGSRAVDMFFKKHKELGAYNDNHITALVFDTDAGDIKSISEATPVVMADTASVGTICDRLGKNHLREWFPCDNMAIRSQEMIRGASQWRKKSYLAFMNLMNKPLERAKFIKALERMVANPGGGCEIYVISSVAGGTGSGSFIPIALYAKRYLRKNLGKDPIVNAMIALPEIYADSQTPENRTKVFANAYAILRELNAINLVARNYNEGRSEQKKAPIKFRIGHPDEPNVGVLFDASDRRFWTPEAAPFSQVFLLDKIPNIKSVIAHDMVLANSLYTILCTGIGAEFDSEFSNHELLRSQNNGSNAIYAGISTSQLRFPKESVLNYLAHRKTMDSCDNEWMMIHRKVETKIREKVQQAKEAKRQFSLQKGEYAQMVLQAFEELEENGGNEAITDLVDRSTATYDQDGNKQKETVVDTYFETIENHISKKITAPKKLKDNVAAELSQIDKPSKEDVYQKASEAKELLLKYFRTCVDDIKRVTTSTADAIITLDSKKAEYNESDWAVEKNILCKDKKHIHPVASLVQLCRLRAKLTEALSSNVAPWEAFNQRVINEIPSHLLKIQDGSDEDENQDDSGADASKSAYLRMGEDRFLEINEEFAKVRTKPKADIAQLKADILTIANNMQFAAQSQLKAKVLSLVAENVDIMIDKYRAFFNRFEKEKEELIEATKTAERLDAGTVDSAINIYSTADDKKAILKDIAEASGPATASDVQEMDHVVGSGVYETVYKSAVAEASNDQDWNDKDSSAYRSLFTNMIKSYREFIGRSEAFQNIATYNVVEAVRASCGKNATKKDIELKLNTVFANAQEMAKPSLRVNETSDFEDLVRPSTITVFMMSLNTAKYIKRHAEEFDINLPADQTNEMDVIKTCASEFIRNYSGNSAARTTIVDKISDQVLYCTGEVMDITPLRIAKFDEMGAENTYYRYYREALNNSIKYNTEIWNPHLGNNLHKRGYLPYMNEAKERECDAQVVKALIYAFSGEPAQVSFAKGVGDNNYYFVYDGKSIKDSNGSRITTKNISGLLDWLRNDDSNLVDLWSEKFDKSIEDQIQALPNITTNTETEIGALEAALTKSPFMKLLTDKLYTDKTETNNVRSKKIEKKNGKLAKATWDGPNLIEFAYMVKSSEEIGRDCDDAERILQVVYDVFKYMCTSRANPALMPDTFIKVYRQQLEKVYEAVAGSKVVYSTGSGALLQFNMLVTWLHTTGVFNDIPQNQSTDENDEVRFVSCFEYTKTSVRAVIDFMCKTCKCVAAEEAQNGESIDDEVQEDEIQEVEASSEEV